MEILYRKIYSINIIKTFYITIKKVFCRLSHIIKEEIKSSLILSISLILITGSLLQILSTSIFVNNDHTPIKISSIYAQDDGDGGDDGGGDDGGGDDGSVLGVVQGVYLFLCYFRTSGQNRLKATGLSSCGGD